MASGEDDNDNDALHNKVGSIAGTTLDVTTNRSLRHCTNCTARCKGPSCSLHCSMPKKIITINDNSHIHLPCDFEDSGVLKSSSFNRKIHHPSGDPNRSPNITGFFALTILKRLVITWHLEPLMDFKPPISMGSPKGVPVPWHSMCTSKQESWHDGICGEMASWLQWKYPKTSEPM